MIKRLGKQDGANIYRIKICPNCGTVFTYSGVDICWSALTKTSKVIHYYVECPDCYSELDVENYDKEDMSQICLI